MKYSKSARSEEVGVGMEQRKILDEYQTSAKVSARYTFKGSRDIHFLKLNQKL